jgi:hypothetical protein
MYYFNIQMTGLRENIKVTAKLLVPHAFVCTDILSTMGELQGLSTQVHTFEPQSIVVKALHCRSRKVAGSGPDEVNDFYLFT